LDDTKRESISRERKITGLNGKLKELDAELTAVEDKNKKLGLSFENLQAKMKKVQASIPNRIHSIQDPLDQKIKQLLKVITSREKSIQEAHSKIDHLNSNVDSLSLKLTKEENNRKVLGQSLGKAQENLKRLTDSIPKKLTEVTSLLKKQIATLQTDRGALKKENAQRTQKINKLTALNSDLTESLQKSKDRLEAIEDVMIDVRKDVKIRQSELADAQKTYDLLNQQHVDIDTAFKEEKNRNAELTVVINEAKKQNQSTIDEYLLQIERQKESFDESQKYLMKSLQEKEASWPRRLAQAKKPLEDNILNFIFLFFSEVKRAFKS